MSTISSPLTSSAEPSPSLEGTAPLSAGTLWIVSTPIGHADDLAPRALTVLRNVRLVVAEDARVTRPLLTHYAIQTEIAAYRPRGVEGVVQAATAVLQQGESVALVSDVGTPLIADPGLSVVRAALEVGAVVRAVPGVNAALAALVVSGFPAGRFAFDGCPPRARSDRQAFFAALAQETRTLLLHESRAGLRATLRDLARVLGAERRVCVARDLTRPSEFCFRGTLSGALVWSAPAPLRGEYVIVVAPTT